MADELDEFHHHPVLVASNEKIDASTTEAYHEEEHDTHTDINRKNVESRQHQIDSNAARPEPEMGKDVHHGKEQHAGGSALRADVGLQLHNLVWLSTHQSCRSRIVEGEPRDGEFQYLPEWDRAVSRTLDDDAPCPGVHDVEENPKSQDGKKPIPRMTDVCPELGE